MDLKEIQALLEKFYNAETTSVEGKVLMEYFEQKDIQQLPNPFFS